MNIISILIGLIVGGGLAGTAVYFYLKPRNDKARQEFENELALKRVETDRESEKLLDTARRESKQIRGEAEKVVERRYQDLARAEERADRQREKVDKQGKRLEHKEVALNKRQSRLDRRQNQIEQTEQARREQLEKIAAMTTDEAKKQLLADVERDSRQDMARVMREIEDEAKESANKKARELIIMAIQRIASDQVAEVTVSTVTLPSEEMKGRIIGRNGRNIRAFEQAAGVDIVVDDTPETVSVSSFDSVRREVARRALEKLITDGRIHPARIEKLLKDATKEVDQVMKEAGEQAAYEANVHGLHHQIIRMMGRLKYRTSYGQNQLHHAVEAAKIASVLAAELGANVEVAKMGAFLHDIGKAMDHEQEGTHAMLGAEFIKRYNVPKIVVNAVAAHHHEVEPESIEAIIVESADAISGARPGARRESLENYIKRVRTLEDIATSHEGVESAYALQAGREIRILVKPDKIDDLAAMQLSKNVAKMIEESMQYPGQIQVTVIRETRSVGFAK
ncbi:MAG: ribonuclease Y [Chloroflexota bacterium]